jgi:hypothetical protein
MAWPAKRLHALTIGYHLVRGPFPRLDMAVAVALTSSHKPNAKCKKTEIVKSNGTT